MQQNQDYIQFSPEDEVSLKDIVLKIKEYWAAVRKLYWVVIAAVVICVGIAYLLDSSDIPEYKAELTFMVNEEEQGGGGLSSILGIVGLGGGGGGFNLTKMLELSKTRRILQNVLFQKALIDNKEDYLANHTIKILKLHKEWEDKEGLQGFLFTSDVVDSFSRQEKRALKTVISQIVGNKEKGIEGIFAQTVDDETGILNFSVKSPSERLSIDLTMRIYNRLSDYYIDQSTERQQNTYTVLKTKADSLQKAMNQKQYQLLKFEDNYRDLVLKQSSAKKIELQRDLQVLSLAYGETVKNQEIADFSLKNSTPVFQVIDEPLEPLYAPQTLIKNIILGIIAGLFIGVGFIIVLKIYKDAMSE